MSQSAAHALIAAVLCLPFEVAAQVRSPGVMGMPPRSVALTFGSQPQSPSSNPFLHQAIFLGGDRKSTRLNSSHQIISYAVFCLKKKNHKKKTNITTLQH